MTSQNNVIEVSSNFEFEYEWELLMVSHYLAKFSGHRYCSSKDICSLCLMIKQDQMIKGLGDYNDRSLLRYVTILSSWVTIGTIVVKI